MSVDSLIFWAFVAAWIVVGGILVVRIVPAIVGETRGIIRHISRLAGGSELPWQIAKAQANVVRIEAAAARLPALQQRAEAALVVIRTTPLVPPTLTRFLADIERRVAALRALTR